MNEIPLRQTRKYGKLIAIEGLDGSGKSSVRDILVQALQERNVDTIGTFEVGATPIAKELRDLCFIKRDEVLDPISRLLMVYAARMQHIRQVIQPHIERGTCVVTDRYNDSTRVYQGKIDGLERHMEQLESLECMRILSSPADITIYLKVDPETAYERGIARKNVNNDTYKNDFSKAVRIDQAYMGILLDRSVKDRSSVFIVNANLSIEQVRDQIYQFADMFASMYYNKVA